MKLFFCDLETTGLDPEKHGIHQMSGCLMVDGKIVEEFNWNMRPPSGVGLSCSPEALKVTGKTMDMLLSYPPESEQYRNLLAMLGRHIDKRNRADKAYWVGYNANFDVGFARKMFERQEDKFFGSWFWSAPVLDLMPLLGFVFPGLRPRMLNFKLGSVAAELGIKPSGELHDAKVDIDLCVELFKLIVAELGPAGVARWFSEMNGALKKAA